MDILTLDLQSLKLTDEQFYQLCIDNHDLRFERNVRGDLLIMPQLVEKLEIVMEE